MPGGSKTGGGLKVKSAYKMKGSPHKLGTIEGTSAFKDKYSYEIITDEKGNPTVKNLTTGKTVVLKESDVFYDENTGKSRLKKSYRDAN
jgi:hypothetical protein